MAHKKAGGSTSLGRDSQAKRLGVKVHAGETVSSGEIIVRQRGSRIHAGNNVKVGGDDTIYAGMSGVVRFVTKKAPKFNGKLVTRKYVHVEPVAAKK